MSTRILLLRRRCRRVEDAICRGRAQSERKRRVSRQKQITAAAVAAASAAAEVTTVYRTQFVASRSAD